MDNLATPKDPWTPLVRLGKVNIGLGILAPVTMIVFLIKIDAWNDWQGVALLSYDLCLSAIAISGATALVRRQPWGFLASCLAGGAIAADAGTELFFWGHELIDSGRHSLNQIVQYLGHRLLYDLLLLVWWLFVLGFLLRDWRPRGLPAIYATVGRRILWMSCITACVISLLVQWAKHRVIYRS